MNNRFDSFIGVDWSGARREWLPGLKVAIVRSGREAPALVPAPSQGGLWSRTMVINALVRHVRRERALIGFDFAFGFPIIEDSDLSLSWQDIENHCGLDPFLYGGAFFRDRTHALGDYVLGPWGKGPKFRANRLRLTERAAARVKGAAPSTVLGAVGAASVGFSSSSGMRALLQIRRRAGSDIAIWPFDPISGSASAAVEIFPRFYPLS